MSVYLAEVRTALANLLNESTTPSPWPAERDNFITWSLQRIAREYDWDFSKGSTSKTLDSTGKYVFLAADGVRFDPDLDVRVVNSGVANDYIFEPVPRDDFDSYTVGDFRYYISTGSDGTQTLVTTEPNKTVQITFSRAAVALSDVIPTDFPSALAIAKGAVIYAREFEDKDADTSVEDAKFTQIMQEIMATEQRGAGPRRAVTRAEMRGHRTGEVQSDRYWL